MNGATAARGVTFGSLGVLGPRTVLDIARLAARDRDGALAAISDRMIQAIDFIGSADEVTGFVRGYLDAGIEPPVRMPMPWGGDRLAVTQATMTAAVRALPG